MSRITRQRHAALHGPARLVLSDRRIQRILGRTLELARPELGCLTLASLQSPESSLAPTPAAAELGFIQFSSGTTGTPRPVGLTHRQVLANVAAIHEVILSAYPEQQGLVHRAVSWLPLYHDMGLVGSVLVAISHPCDLVLLPPELFVSRPAAWLRAISRFRGTVSPAPNFAFALCADRVSEEDLRELDLSCWRVALNGAEPVTPAVLRRFVRRFAPAGFAPQALTPVYGLSEATLAVTFSDLTRPFRATRFDPGRLNQEGRAAPAEDGEALVSLGRPLPGFALRVAGDGGQELPPGGWAGCWSAAPRFSWEVFSFGSLQGAQLTTTRTAPGGSLRAQGSAFMDSCAQESLVGK